MAVAQSILDKYKRKFKHEFIRPYGITFVKTIFDAASSFGHYGPKLHLNLGNAGTHVLGRNIGPHGLGFCFEDGDKAVADIASPIASTRSG